VRRRWKKNCRGTQRAAARRSYGDLNPTPSTTPPGLTLVLGLFGLGEA
jgi:hypothetical protein